MQMYGLSGEVLGTIGSTPNTHNNALSLPSRIDREVVPASPSSTTRKCIAWTFDLPYEDTDTIVLTASNGTFVDIRFPKHFLPSRPLHSHVSFWALAGSVTTTRYPYPTEYMTHATFTHDIDSRGDSDAVDEGDMVMLPTGEELEVGQMLNVETGRVELYKEWWVGVRNPGPGSTFTDKQFCFLAKLRGATDTVKSGVLIRVRGYVQMIVQLTNGDVQVARIEWQTDRWHVDRRNTANPAMVPGLILYSWTGKTVDGIVYDDKSQLKIGQECLGSDSSTVWRIEEANYAV